MTKKDKAINTNLPRINRDGTVEWKSSKIKGMLIDFDGKTDDRIITGKSSSTRTEVITFCPTESTNTLEIMGVVEKGGVTVSNRKSIDIDFLELRGVIDSSDEKIIIAGSIIKDRLEKMGYIVLEKKKIVRKYGVGFGQEVYD
jgi:hypothetical protein